MNDGIGDDEVMNEILGAEVANELVPKVYDDIAKPALQSTGGVLALIPRAIKASLAPLEKWILNREFQIKETMKLLEKKLENVSPEQIETPEPYIAVPAFQYISYCMDNHELRDMYANLLASSMNKAVKNGVHPGYSEIIKQLCPDEAKILKYIAEKGEIPTVSLYYGNSLTETVRITRNFSDVGFLTHCEKPLDVNKYFENFVRLGLVESPESVPSLKTSLTDMRLYESLKNHPYIQSLINDINNPDDKDNEPEIVEGYIELSDFGKGFCAICIGIQPKADKSAVIEQTKYLRKDRDMATDEEFDEMLKDIGLLNK